MYPLFRFITTSVRAKFYKPLAIDGVDETHFICMPWDMDMFLEMNNGRVLTLYDLGRFCFAIRSGLSKVLKKKRWGLVVAGSTVIYRKRVRTFDRVTIKTKMLDSDERWFYIEQSMWVKGQATSSILLRTGITGAGSIVPTGNVLKEMGVEKWEPEHSAWLESWIASENNRPWPPD